MIGSFHFVSMAPRDQVIFNLLTSVDYELVLARFCKF